MIPKQLLKKFRKTVRVIDVFGTPISFNFDGQEVYKSAVGGVSTIIVTILMFVAFSVIICSIQSQISSFMNKETIYFETNSSFTSNPQALQLDNTNFLFAMKVEQSSSEIFNQLPYFNIVLTQSNYTTINGNTTRISKILELEPCNIKKFSQFGQTFQNLFSTHQLSEFICLSDQTLIYLQGAFLNTEFSFAKIQVQTCNQYTNQAKWNVSCASQNQIDQYLSSNGQFRLVLYTTNYVVNPTIADKFSEIYLSEDLNFLFQPGQIKQSANIFFKEYEVSTDQSLFINTDIVKEKFIFREEGNFKIETVIDLKNQNVNSSPLTLYFRSDFLKQSASRRFLKIDQLLAYFGGIFNILVLAFSVIVKQYNSTYYQLKMANRLYQYPNQNTPSSAQDISPNEFNNLTLISECDSAIGKQSTKRIKWKNKIEYLYYLFKNNIIKSSKVYPQLSYVGYLITFKKKFRTLQNLLIEESISQIQQDSNVRILIKKIQEIDKLKTVLLDQNQLKLFNFMQRPIIQVQCNETPILSRGQQRQQQIQNFQDLLRAYQYILSQQEMTLVSTQILGSLGQKMINLFEKIQKEEAEENCNQLSDIAIKNYELQQYIII